MLVKRMWVLSVLLCCACSKEAPIVSAPDAAASWPRFHGPKSDNISSETGLLKKWPKGGPTLAWKTKGLGAGFASVSLAHGLIYTAGNLNDKTTITCCSGTSTRRSTTSTRPRRSSTTANSSSARVTVPARSCSS